MGGGGQVLQMLTFDNILIQFHSGSDNSLKLIVYPNIVSSLKVIDRISITNFINFQEKSQKGDGEGSRLRVRP